MANPQKENGFTSVANEIVEALCLVQLSGHETRVLLAVLRKTYGWNKKEDAIALSQFREITGLPEKKVSESLGKLVAKNIVIVQSNGRGKTKSYSLQKDYSKWSVSPKTGIPENRDTRKQGYPEGENGGDCASAEKERDNSSVGIPENGYPRKRVSPKTGIPENGDQVSPKTGSTKDTTTKDIKPSPLPPEKHPGTRTPLFIENLKGGSGDGGKFEAVKKIYHELHPRNVIIPNKIIADQIREISSSEATVEDVKAWAEAAAATQTPWKYLMGCFKKRDTYKATAPQHNPDTEMTPEERRERIRQQFIH